MVSGIRDVVGHCRVYEFRKRTICTKTMFKVHSMSLIVILQIRMPFQFSPKMTDQHAEAYRRLICQFSEFCDAHCITWMPVCGSLLSVIRHNTTFIPWDDDFDVSLRKRDEDIFMQLAANGSLSDNLKVSCCGYRTEQGGMLYKVYSTTSINYFNKDAAGNSVNFGWPFVDVWVNCDKDGPMGCKTMTTAEEDSLESVYTFDDMHFKIPSQGPRCIETFKKIPELMSFAVDDPWNHALQMKQVFTDGNEPKPLELAVTRNHLLRSSQS